MAEEAWDRDKPGQTFANTPVETFTPPKLRPPMAQPKPLVPYQNNGGSMVSPAFMQMMQGAMLGRQAGTQPAPTPWWRQMLGGALMR